MLKSRLPFGRAAAQRENDFCNVLLAVWKSSETYREHVPRGHAERKKREEGRKRERDKEVVDSVPDVQDVISKETRKRSRSEAGRREEIMPDPFEQSC